MSDKKGRPDWEMIRAEYGIGGPDNSIRSIATRHGISHTAINKRKRVEDWPEPEDLDEVIRRKVSAKVSNVVSTGNQAKRAEAIDAAADRRAAIVLKHQAEWDEVSTLRTEAMKARTQETEVFPDGRVVSGTDKAFNKAKLAKIMAEVTSIKQAAERKAWSLDAKEQPGLNGADGAAGRVGVVMIPPKQM
jgi:hypothetical protein